MAFIDMVEWNPQSNAIFAYRFPNSNLSTATQLIVRESQEAVFFAKGRVMGKFGPGKYTLTTENLPLLRNFFGIPFGGKNPFVAEVWFVNKSAPLNIDWKTTAMRFLDPDYGQMIPLVATGRYGLKVVDAERFLIQLVGTLSQFTSRELTDHFMGALIAKTNSSIMAFMNANHVGINQIAGYLDELSRFIGQPMAEFWESYGFSLEGFYITSVDLDTSTPEGKKISEALSDRSAQGIAGYTWQQKQSFDMANHAVGSGSSMGGILGAAMLAGAFSSSGMGSAMMQQPTANPYSTQGMQGQMQGQAPIGGGYAGGMNSMNGMGGIGGAQSRMHARTEVFCSNCGKKYPTTSKFCPFCGDPYRPCPACGADNAQTATRCVTCGTMLSPMQSAGGNVCGKCGMAVQPGTRFCPNCGNRL